MSVEKNSSQFSKQLSNKFKDILKLIILICCVRPFVWFFLGLNRYSRIQVPKSGPLIIASNHNSHLDTLLILGLLPLSVAVRTRFVAAGDYFYNIPIVSWVLFDLFEMIPVWRKQKDKVPSATAPVQDSISVMSSVLQQGKVIVIFPEGSRGLPEQRASLRRGIAKLSLLHPTVPIVPLYIRGLGKSLPRGDFVFVPLIPQLIEGEPLVFQNENEAGIMEKLTETFSQLENQMSKKDWVEA